MSEHEPGAEKPPSGDEFFRDQDGSPYFPAPNGADHAAPEAEVVRLNPGKEPTEAVKLAINCGILTACVTRVLGVEPSALEDPDGGAAWGWMSDDGEEELLVLFPFNDDPTTTLQVNTKLAPLVQRALIGLAEQMELPKIQWIEPPPNLLTVRHGRIMLHPEFKDAGGEIATALKGLEAAVAVVRAKIHDAKDDTASD
jgi:hypothetical protein